MTKNHAKFLPSEIRFSHDNISDSFRNRKPIQRTVERLKTGKININAIPRIKIVKRDGLKFSVNNRRLYVFQRYEEFLRSRDEIIAIPVKFGVHKDLKDFKLSTRDEGLTVEIRDGNMPNKLKSLKISDIRYSKDAIYLRDKKRSPEDILKGLENGTNTIDTLPKITVVQRKGNFYAIDNERVLWAVKQYYEKQAGNIELKCKLGKYSDLGPTSFTTTTDGLSVRLLPGRSKRKVKPEKCLKYLKYSDRYHLDFDEWEDSSFSFCDEDAFK